MGSPWDPDLSLMISLLRAFSDMSHDEALDYAEMKLEKAKNKWPKGKT